MLLAYVKAESIKNRSTVAAKLFWIVPLISFVVSFLFSPRVNGYYQMNQFNQWYTMLLPMLLLLSTAFVVQRERKLKNRAMGALPIDMRKLWMAKVFYSIKTLVLAVALLLCMEEIYTRFIPGSGARVISGGAVLGAAALWIILSLWQIPLWLFLNQVVGFAASFLIGLACNIGLGVFGALSSGWMLNPFSYISRLMCPVLKILPNGLMAAPGNQTFTPGALDASVMPLGIVLSLLLFIIMLLLTAIWYKRKGTRGWEN